MEEQLQAGAPGEAMVRVAPPLLFYNLLIKGEFAVVDLGTPDEFGQSRLMGAQNFPPLMTTFVDDLGYERRDKVLVYARQGEVDPSDPRVTFLRRQKYVKEVLLLQGGAASFAERYPFLLLGNERSAMDNFVAYPSQMLPSPSGLFLGSQITSTSRKVLNDLNIKHIINVTNEVFNSFESDEEMGIAYHRCCITDDVTENIHQFFRPMHLVIDRARKSGENVLVHCAQGRSRSASVVTAYLMLSEGWDFQKAYSHVCLMRDGVRVNDGFRRQLLMLDAELREEEAD